MGTYMLGTWIKSITGQNNLAYFQSKLIPEIDPTCRLCLVQASETRYHLMTDCEATTSLTSNGHDINKFKIHLLMTYDTQYNNREIEYIDHNYSSDASSL